MALPPLSPVSIELVTPQQAFDQSWGVVPIRGVAPPFPILLGRSPEGRSQLCPAAVCHVWHSAALQLAFQGVATTPGPVSPSHGSDPPRLLAEGILT